MREESKKIMNSCSRGHVGGMFEDIEPSGYINQTCMFCGDIQYTADRITLSPGNPVMWSGGGYDVLEPPDYFAEVEPEPSFRRYTLEQVETMEAMWHSGTSPTDIAREFNVTAQAVYGVLRRRPGRQI